MKPQIVVIFLFAALLLSACGGPNTATLGTPMPPAIPATPPQFASLDVQPPAAGQEPCRVHAVELIGAWVTAGAKETEPFPFTDLDGQSCQGDYAADIQPLFVHSNVWYTGAPACVTCHYAETATAWTQLDLSSYAGVVAGSRRATPDAKGTDILGAGTWEKAILFTQFNTLRMPPGRPAGSDPKGPVIAAGVRP